MPDNREKQGRGDTRGDPADAGAGLDQLLAARSLLDTLSGGATGPPPTTGQIISPVDIQRLLRILRDLPLDLGQQQLEQVDPLRRELSNVVSMLQKLSSELVTRQLEDGLAWIYHPIYGDSVAAARIRQLIHVLAASIRRMWRNIAENFENMSSEELAKSIEVAELSTKLAFLVITDTWAKIMTLFFANAPPAARPPLVNAALGYELVDYGRKPGAAPATLLERLRERLRGGREESRGRRQRR